jgi:hypothetical protein
MAALGNYLDAARWLTDSLNDFGVTGVPRFTSEVLLRVDGRLSQYSQRRAGRNPRELLNGMCAGRDRG